MPQMNKGGKFIFGKSSIRNNLQVHFPPQAIEEKEGFIELTEEMLKILDLSVGMELLSIRSSDIAFTMGAKGPLLEKAKNYQGIIDVY